MKILGVVCSPRVGGNTEIVMREAMSGAKQEGAETELIFIREKNIQPCDGCFRCWESGECHIKDDMQALYTKLLDSDGILIGTPTYLTICGQGAIFLDRTLPLLYTGKLANKVGGGIAVGARIAVDTVLAVFRRFFLYGHMLCVECVAGYASGKGDIVKDEWAMKASWELGRLMVLFAKQGNKFPEEFYGPLSSYVYQKHGVARYPKP
jgi:multimeric flavodoxin WrbA